MTPLNPEAPVSWRDRGLLWGGALLGLGSILLPKLALIGVFASWVVLISRQRLCAHWPRIAPLGIAAALVGSLVGMGRFTLSEAIPGIMRGGNQAADKNAVSRVRQIVTAQDAMRRGAYMDHDRDGIGSAGRIAELVGFAPLRALGVMNTPALSYPQSQLVDTAMGPAVQVGAYLLIVCLPGTEGFTARAGDAIDEERAERGYIAYAWPLGSDVGPKQVYAADQHERIWVSPNVEAGTVRYAGASFPPPCDSVHDPKAQFQPWMNKAPRQHLPGDHPQ